MHNRCWEIWNLHKLSELREQAKTIQMGQKYHPPEYLGVKGYYW